MGQEDKYIICTDLPKPPYKDKVKEYTDKYNPIKILRDE